MPMKLARTVAALIAAACVLFAVRPAGAGGAGAQGSSVPPAPTVLQQAQGAPEPGQALCALPGGAATAAFTQGTTGQWVIMADTSVYGSTCIEPGQKFLLGGHTLTIYGDFTISGTLDLDGGKLIVRRDPNASQHADGSLIVEGGLLVMQHAGDLVQVEHAFIANGQDEAGMLTAGTVTVGGDFLQLQGTSSGSYAASGAHITQFSGASALAQFYSPAFSAVCNLRMAAGAAFTTQDRQIDVILSYTAVDGQLVRQAMSYPTTGGTFLSLSQALSADTALTAPNLYYRGSQNGKKLTLAGNLIVPQGFSQVFSGDVAATNVFVSGTLDSNTPGRVLSASGLMSVTGALNMDAGDVSAKDFVVSGACAMMGGTLDISGSFRQVETNGVPASRQAFRAGEGSLVRFAGAACTCLFDSPGDSYFNAVTLASGASFAADAAVSVKRDLAQDMAIQAPLVYYTGDLNGRTLDVTGSLAVPAGFSLKVGGGTLLASGNIIAEGALLMDTTGDHVSALGDFLARGNGSAYTHGLLEVGGTLRQCGPANGGHADSFVGGAGLTVRLDAAQAQWGARLDNPETSYLSALEVASNPAHAISGDSVIALRGTLAADLKIPAQAALYFCGSLNGHRLSAGDITIPAGQTLTVGTGRLDASTLDVKGTLDMQAAAGAVAVAGAFTAEGPDSGGHLAQGFLAVGGRFAQNDDASPRSFCPSESFKTLLTGSTGQRVSFESPADPGATFDAPGSWFGALYTYGTPDYETAHYACSVSATGIGLSGLAASSASGAVALAPAFSGFTAAYGALLPEGDGTVTLAADRLFANQKVSTAINGAALPGDSFTGSNTLNVDTAGTAVITLEAASAAGVPTAGAGEPFARVYTLTVQPVNSKLASVALANAALDAGVTFLPSDNATLYTTTVPLAKDTFTLTPTPANPNASFRFIYGGAETTGASFTHGINPGQTVEVDVQVTAAGGAAQRTYRFAVRRQALITGISVSSGALQPAFGTETTGYTVDVPTSVYTLTVTPQQGDGCAAVSINGQVRDTVTLSPAIGGSAQAQITLADASGAYTRTTTVTVRRAALLSGISVQEDVGSGPTPVALQPSFTSATRTYVADVPVNASVTVTAAKTSDCASVTVNGDSSGSGTLDVAPGGQADAVVAASAGAKSEQQATYTVTVRKPLLVGLNLSAGALGAPFDPDAAGITTVLLPYTASSVTLAPVANDGGAGLISVDYADASGACTATVALVQGETKRVTVHASYVGGGPAVERSYTVDITRALSDNADMDSFGATAGWLSPAFAPDTTDYTLLLPETATSVVLSPALADASAHYQIGSLPENTPCTLAVPAGSSASADIVVTALRGNTQTYHITALHTQTLTALVASPTYGGYASLSPGGTDRMTFTYSLALPASVKMEVKKGSRWYTVATRTEVSPCIDTVVWDGKVSSRTLSTGSYSVRFTPISAGKAGFAKTMTVKILSKPSVSVTRLSPGTLTANGTNKLTLGFKWSRLCDVRVDVVTSKGALVCTLYTAANQAPRSATLYWDGKNASGSLVSAGTYKIKIICGGKTEYKTIKIKR